MKEEYVIVKNIQDKGGRIEERNINEDIEAQTTMK